MKVFICTNHNGHLPIVAKASIVIAEDKEQAQALLDAELISDGLEPFEKKPYTLREVSTEEARAKILCNGDY